MSAQTLSFLVVLALSAGCPLMNQDATTNPTHQAIQKESCEQVLQTIDDVCEDTRAPWPDDAVYPKVGPADIQRLETTREMDSSCAPWVDLAEKRTACVERMQTQIEAFERAKQERIAQTAPLADAVRADSTYAELVQNGYWEDKAEYETALYSSQPPANLGELESRYRRKRDGIAVVLEGVGLTDPEATWHEVW